MSTPRKFHIQAGEYDERDRESRVERIGKVVRFVTANPLSTADDVFKATGVSVMVAVKYLKQCQYEGKTCWRLNRKKLEI